MYARSPNTADGDETAPETRRLSADLQARAAEGLFPLFRAGDAASD